MIRLFLIFLFSIAIQYTSASELMERAAAKDSTKQKRFTTSEGASSKRSVVIQPMLNFGHHLGFGKLNYGGVRYGSGSVPGVTLNIDYSVHDYVSVGVFYSAAFRNYKTANVFYLGNAFGVRTAFHWWQLIDDKSDSDLYSEKLDFDIHVHLGGYLVSYKDKTLDTKTKQLGFNAGGGVALRYYFVRAFGVVIEGGYEETAFGKIGFAIKI